MCNVFADIKRIACFAAGIAFVVLFFGVVSANKNIDYVYAVSDIENEYNDVIDKTIDDIDSTELDEFLNNEILLGVIDSVSFKDIVGLVLSGELFSDYNSLSNVLLKSVKTYFMSSLKLILLLLVIVVIYKLFESFCLNKYMDIKKIIRIIFTLVIVYILIVLLKDMADNVKNSALKIFNLSELLFPILLSLVLSSGASVSYASYSSLSVIVLETFSYIFIYVLIPISISIMVFSLAGCVSSKDTLSKIVDLLKSIFKYVIVAIVAVFGLFSSITVISSGMKDGVSLKLTKYAIKNYVPVLGGYISEGFDFVKSASVIVKNAVGLSGIVVLFFNILSPVLIYISYILVFKILSIVVSFLDEEKFAGIFNGVSKSISYFMSVLIGLFMILLVFIYMMIISVSVV